MAVVLVAVLQLATLVLFGRAILSWFRIEPSSPMFRVKQTVDWMTEPILSPIRRLLPRTGRVDLSVLVALLGINLLLMPIALRL